MRRATTQRLNRGLTLLELLLTVTIFSLVVAVFSQALFQVGVLEQATARHLGLWQREWLQGFALDDYFAAQLENMEPGAKPAAGEPLRYTTAWVEQAGSGAGQVRAVTLTLRAARTGSDWELAWKSGDEAEVVLTQWAQPVQFRYVDMRGRVTDQWPGLQSAAGETLPSAVQVVGAREALLHQWNFAGWAQPRLTQPGAAAAFSGVTP